MISNFWGDARRRRFFDSVPNNHDRRRQRPFLQSSGRTIAFSHCRCPTMPTIENISPDILARIFAILAKDAQDASVEWLLQPREESHWRPNWTRDIGAPPSYSWLREPRAPSPYSWICVTHVCRSWRVAALGCPSLWAHICVFREDRTKEMVRRARKQPLTITISPHWRAQDVPEYYRKASLTSLVKLLDTHTRPINAVVIPWHDLTLSAVPKFASSLRTLILTGRPCPMPQHPAWSLPCLEELRLSFSPPSALSTLLFPPTLRKLVLSPTGPLQPNGPTDSIDNESLVEILLRLPLLVYLDVSVVDPSLRGMEPLPDVLLPSLQMLRIRGELRSRARLFCALWLPPSVCIDMPFASLEKPPHGLDSRNKTKSVNKISPTLDLIASAACGRGTSSPLPPILTLKITRDDYGIQVDGWRKVQEHSHRDTSPDVRIHIRMDCDGEDAAILLSVLPLQHLEVLNITGPFDSFDVNDDEMPPLKRLASLTTLRVLTLADCGPEEAMDLLDITTAVVGCGSGVLAAGGRTDVPVTLTI
ncbi:hypothetical protein PsYK624_135360 [Phanerochaete sordida]|uniref:F-box domain-containing protein n=1 Tax=Phanerochaete sordida TaxID=48140 RepID=A0A9P3GPS3_9APHY|nr:hypothetical protein PsYK624_135360 [Phanerochaete sordida]